MDTTQLELGGLRSSVVVDGSDVPHYGVQYDENAKEVTSWIVSEKDQPFVVHSEVINRIPGESYVVHVYLDGHKAAGRVVRPQDPSFFLTESVRVSYDETRSFMFGSLELSDDDTLLEASANALGEIKLLFYRVGTMVPSYGNYAPAPQAQKVHERSKKGLAHSVKYGGTQLDPLDPTTVHFLCLDKTLIASHIIRYRPLAMLQANGIVPYVPANNGKNTFKSPSPVPGPSSAGSSKKRKSLREEDVKPVIDLTNDDDDEGIDNKEDHLKEQLAQLQERRARLQQRPAKKAKQEERRPILPKDVIDLTV